MRSESTTGQCFSREREFAKCRGFPDAFDLIATEVIVASRSHLAALSRERIPRWLDGNHGAGCELRRTVVSVGFSLAEGP